MIQPIAADLSSQTCLVTGASAGIGLEVARDLASLGAQVILACRDRGRGERACADIVKTLPGAKLALELVDLAEPASIRALASVVLDKHPGLHALVNNAGVWLKARAVNSRGVELTWATNVLGYHLLTELLADRLSATGSARVVNVASGFAYGLDLADLGFERRGWDGSAAYAQSKQADRMLSWAQARRFAGRGITVNAMHPGPVDTALLRQGAPSIRGRTPAQGADTASWLVAERSLAGQTGKFWMDRRERRCEFRSAASEDAVWNRCAEMTVA
jgi:dehydrogenase/reductase SDR family member 12